MLDHETIAVALVALIVGSAVGAGVVATVAPPSDPADPSDPAGDPPIDRRGDFRPDGNDTRSDLAAADVAQFESEADFRAYVQRSRSGGHYFGLGRRVAFTGGARGVAEGDAEQSTGDAAKGGGGGGNAPDRVSDTNVQEAALDEPDVLKTDGKTVYYGVGRGYGSRAEYGTGTRILDVDDPANPDVVANVPVTGRMLLSNDTLVVFNQEAVYGYDVSDRVDPERLWEKDLNGTFVTARLYQDRVYLVTSTGIDVSDPCPVRPFGGEGPSIDCTEVYHPTRTARADATYTTMTMDPESGDVVDAVSVVGSRQHRATYVSENAVYLTYTRRASQFDLFSTFLLENKSDVLDSQAERRIRELRELNISDRAKQVELGIVVRNWYGRMSEEKRKEVRKEVTEDFQAYLQDNKRELVRTGIVKVGLSGDSGDLSVAATGEVPGYPLNQFSMDERDGRLRIATTVGRQWGGSPENDLYVLNGSLGIEGSVKGMAPNERIFSVRYVGDTAYLVTFRRIDPFHVVDLSDPQNPEELGNVELPGFSRYLHPIGEDRVLGVGEEDGKVKAVIFDVSEPSNPKVEDSLIVDDRWSAVSKTHHAFLQDSKHGVFFLPGSQGGYVIDYTGGDLELEKRVDTREPARRAMYLNDYLYVFGTEEVVVVDETDWTVERRVDLDDFGAEDDDDSRDLVTAD